MKARMYWSYATRSLARGGQRTLLAIFCVAVGVLAIVALQLVGDMVNNALTSNVREGNGGDLSISSPVAPLTTQQMGFFAQLRGQGQITGYTAVSRHRAQAVAADGSHYFSLRAVDPGNFPLVGAPLFATPGGSSLATLLSGENVIITQDLATMLHARVGDTVTVTSDDGRTVHATIDGVIQNAGFFQATQMLIAVDAYGALPSTAGLPVSYTNVYANVPGDTDANAAAVERTIEDQIPVANVTSTKEALQGNQDKVDSIRHFLQVVGLLALLIGGVGIINTMQVLLRRRRTEIAMLKTAGYRQGDLYTLFGLEAGLLGLLGGVVGAAAGVGASFLVKGTVERAFYITLPTTIDPMTVASGVAIGFCTALIFGLMPIVEASQVRPIAVLRELPEGARTQSIALSILLPLLLAGLFFVLVLSILQDLTLAAIAVGGAGTFLFALSLFFTVVVVVISKLPVPAAVRWWQVLLVLVGLAAGAGMLWAAETATLAWASVRLGIVVLAVTLVWLGIVLLPRTWKLNMKLALRNLGRQKARTVTTMVALYIGVFATGLILVLGQNIKDQINSYLTTQQTYNSFIVANVGDRAALNQALNQPPLASVPRTANEVAQDVPVAVNTTPIATILKNAPKRGSLSSTGRNGALFLLSGLQGYDLGHGQTPGATLATGADGNAEGRNLGTGDSGTVNAILPSSATEPPLNLHLGDRITVADARGKTQVTVTVVGFYAPTLTTFAPIYTDTSVVEALTARKPLSVYSLYLDPKTADNTLARLQQQVPGIQTLSVVDLAQFITALLNNLIVMLEAVASLAMLAGIIIIANAVALAMLERRRELGILKAVGHTSRSVLSGVLLENGVVGLTAGLLAMVLVALATTILSKEVFKTDFGVSLPIVAAITVSSAMVAMLVASAVAWRATRVRPLDVLRYE